MLVACPHTHSLPPTSTENLNSSVAASAPARPAAGVVNEQRRREAPSEGLEGQRGRCNGGGSRAAPDLRLSSTPQRPGSRGLGSLGHRRPWMLHLWTSFMQEIPTLFKALILFFRVPAYKLHKYRETGRNSDFRIKTAF